MDFWRWYDAWSKVELICANHYTSQQCVESWKLHACCLMKEQKRTRGFTHWTAASLLCMWQLGVVAWKWFNCWLRMVQTLM